MDGTTHTNDFQTENSAFLKLPLFYKKNGYVYQQVLREGDVAIFSQHSEGKIVGYEVFEIRKQKEADWGEVHYEAKEKVPSTEEWGNNAYTTQTLKKAMDRMFEIQLSIENRKNKNNEL